MSTFILVDVMNLFFRAKWTTQGDIDIKAGMALHIILNSIKKTWREHKGSHVVLCLDGKSWRRNIYPAYKAHRQVEAELRSPKEKQDDEAYFDVMEQFLKFAKERTNMSVLQGHLIEADDWIARWVQLHKNDNHIIVSSDSDFFQLIADNVSIYDGIKGHLITKNTVLNDKGQAVIDKKTGYPMEPPNAEWELFKKIMRGDPGDNIMSAFPGVREKSSKKAIGLRDAFEDRHTKAYPWNNLMLQTWVDHDGKTQKVLECYELNKTLVDLSCQPSQIKEFMDDTIVLEVKKEPHKQIGIWLLKFCNIYGLMNISKNPKEYADFLSATYSGIRE
jgi:5'-3' exonuclease